MPGRYLKNFLDPVASLCPSMSPIQATATPFIPNIIDTVEGHNPATFSQAGASPPAPPFPVGRYRGLRKWLSWPGLLDLARTTRLGQDY